MLDLAGFDLAFLLSLPQVRKELPPPEDEEQGLVFRLAEPKHGFADISERKEGQLQTRLRPAGPSAVCARISSGGVCEKVQNVGFTDGMLTDYPREFAQPHSGSAGDSEGNRRRDCAARRGGSLGGSGDDARSPSANGKRREKSRQGLHLSPTRKVILSASFAWSKITTESLCDLATRLR